MTTTAVILRDVSSLLHGRPFYKAVGDEGSFAEYNEPRLVRIVQTRQAEEEEEEEENEKDVGNGPSAAMEKKMSREWACLHVQATQQHAESTIDYRWDQGYGEAKVLEERLDLLPREDIGDVSAKTPEFQHRVFLCEGGIFGEGTVSGDTKAEAVKLALLAQSIVDADNTGDFLATPLSTILHQEKILLVVTEVGDEQDAAALTHANEDGNIDDGLLTPNRTNTFAPPLHFLAAAELILPHECVPIVFHNNPSSDGEELEGTRICSTHKRPKYMGPPTV